MEFAKGKPPEKGLLSDIGSSAKRH